MTNPIATIIETLLDEHRDAGTHSNPELANAIANTLTAAAWEQFAALTGCEVAHDAADNIVIATGCPDVNMPEPKIIYGRDLTQAEVDAAASFNRYEDEDGNYTLLNRPTAESHERMKRIARDEEDEASPDFPFNA